MKYDHLVKHNGIYYQAGEDVPKSSPVLVEEKKEEAQQLSSVMEEEKPVEKQSEDAIHYKKSDIVRMSTADLKALAPTVGIAVTDETTGAELKRLIIAKLGL